MRFSIVENLSGLSGSIFCLFRSPQCNFRTKSQIDYLYSRDLCLPTCWPVKAMFVKQLDVLALVDDFRVMADQIWNGG